MAQTNFSRLMSASGDAIMPILLIATNDVLADNRRDEANAFVTWAARPLIAEAVTQKWAATYGARDADQIMARAYGEMMGNSSVRNKNSINDRDNARQKIIGTLQQSPPHINELRSLIVDIVRRCSGVGNALAPADECAAYIPGNREVSIQTLTFYSMQGHVLADLFLNDNAARAWRNLPDLDIDHIDLANIDFSLKATYADIWRQAEVATILGYYEGKAVQNMDKVHGMIGGAVFCYLSSMTKESNITQAWVHRRRMQFQDRIPGVNFEAYISEGIVKQFARMYLPIDAEWEDVYRRLVVCWSMLQVPEGIFLSWIIEQGSNSNVTSMTTIADVIAKLQYFDCELLITKGMPVTNFSSVLTQARDLLRNPFCSVVRPTVNIRQYVDLAYLCTYIKRDLFRDQAFAGYRGQQAAMCTLSEAD